MTSQDEIKFEKFVVGVESVDAVPIDLKRDLRDVFETFLKGIDLVPKAVLGEDEDRVIIAWENNESHLEMELVGNGRYEWFWHAYGSNNDFEGGEDLSLLDLTPVAIRLIGTQSSVMA